MIDPLYWMALSTGLLGSGHCIGMCGGIVGALALCPSGCRGGWTFHFLYNAGRILTYGFIGLLVGWLGSAIAYTDHFRSATRALLIGSDLFLILLGLGTAGLLVRVNLNRLEVIPPVQALTAVVARLRLLPPSVSAFPLGLLLGFLPCGWLYAVAISAAQTADPLKGVLTLLAFGLGTAPALLLFGGVAGWISARARSWMLRGAGLMVAAMGACNLFRHLRMMGLW